MSHALIVLPDDTAQPILDAIDGAKKSLRVKMFLFSDPTFLDAVTKARRRDVKVQVMLNPARRNGESENEETTRELRAAKIEVIDSNPEFAVTHEKSMVVDNAKAFVKSLNWVTKNLTQTRDYAIVTTESTEVDEIAECFDADWNRKPFPAGERSRMIWCTANGRDRIARFIDEAKHTLFVQNERYQDTVIIERLVRAKERGVKIHILAKPVRALKLDQLAEGVGGLRIMDDIGIKIHTLSHLKLHGKMLLADHSRAVVGSINLTPGSFDSRRELAIEVQAVDVVERLSKIAHHDWKHSHALDLSDEGLRRDFEQYKGQAAEKLALHEETNANSHS